MIGKGQHCSLRTREIDQARREEHQSRCFTHATVSIECRNSGHGVRGHERARGRTKIHRDPLRLLIDPVDDECGDGTVPPVRVQQEESPEAMSDETPHRFDVYLLHQDRGQRHGTGEFHVIR